MATLNELVQEIARVEGMDPATVTLIARLVREEELIVMRGRGPSAAQMGLSDAVNLLIAVNAASRVNNAAKIVPDYRAMVPHEYESVAKRLPVKRSGTFGDALEQLILAVAHGDLPRVFMGREVPKKINDHFRCRQCAIWVTFTASYFAATVRLQPVDGTSMPEPTMRFDTKEEFAVTFYPVARMRRAAGSVSQRSIDGVQSDRVVETTISHRTIAAIAQLIVNPALDQARETVASLKTKMEAHRKVMQSLLSKKRTI